MILTGPNASGKTTVLKSALINIIFTQQIGSGFYESAQLHPFDFIHCYLNIPDTSGRDSLFQAEARRCMEILDIIRDDEHAGKTHFCAFDELYSGTNPDDAVMSALAFMEFLIKSKNVTCILTTHFIEVCKRLDTHKAIENYHMKTEQKEQKEQKGQKEYTDFNYTYILKKGISNLRGGLKILHDMNYPKEIIDKTREFQ
jgi:DNA mismatch repair ATPase MutS